MFERSVPGTYVSNNSINSIDTLRIDKDGSYEHVIYRTNDSSLVFVNTGSWKYQSGNLDLHDFFDNQDRLYKKDIDYNFEENLMLVSTPVTIYPSETRIDIYSDLGYYYIKVQSLH